MHFSLCSMLSTVFRAKRLTDFVSMRSILPFTASSIIRLKPSRFFVFVSVIPSEVQGIKLICASLYKGFERGWSSE